MQGSSAPSSRRGFLHTESVAAAVALPPARGGVGPVLWRDVYDNVSDCLDGQMRAKAIEKARRAIAVAGEEPQVKAAVRMVEQLLGRAEDAI
jgi:hypothetical protein